MILDSPIPEWLGAVTLAELIAPWLGVIAAVWLTRKAYTTVWPWVRRVTRFLDDWQGTEEPGHPREPGVPERLLVLETRLQRVRLAVAELDAKVDAYHGSI